ncbi:MAG: NAD(P)-dependent oxidoreductase [Candidatus Hydrogenedentota bacterium]
MKRLLVTGAGGFVGAHVVRNALPTWEVHGLSGKPQPGALEGARWHVGDIAHGGYVKETLYHVRPDAVVHCAAIADIDYCESHKDDADRINVDVTREIAGVCRTLGIRLVHCSTDTVFQGEQGLYREDDAVNPVNYYGQTKVKAEQTVQQQLTDYSIARIALVMGYPVAGDGNSFLAKWVKAWTAHACVEVPENEVRTPIDCPTLSRALVELAGRKETGVFHLAGDDCLNRFEIAKRVALALDFDPALVEPTDSSQMKGRAPRPRDCSLVNARARSLLATPLCGLEEGLRRIMIERK